MESRGLRFRVKAYVGAISLAAAGAVLATALARPTKWGAEFVVFCVVAAGAEFYAVTFPSGAGASLSYPLSIAGLVLLGPSGGALAAAASTLTSVRRQRKDFWVVFFFNLSQVTLSATLSGWCYAALGGRAILGAALRGSDFPGVVLPFTTMIIASIVLNDLFVGIYFLLSDSITPRQFWRSTVSWTTPTQVALGIVGLSIAQIVSLLGVLGLALFVAPLLVARETYNRYIALREAYADTVRSLVAAIEAKDAYTKGHSVRVAEYALAIARRLLFDEVAQERIEYAALLHDLGKVGVSDALISKPGRLTADEQAEIRRHPDIGSSIIASVPYLADIAPVVQHHHERMDGNGYGMGLAGDAIPLAARILAVADSYDAMTSARPYRAAMSPRHALEELLAGAGTQFDREVVSAMADCLVESAAEDHADLEGALAGA